MNFQYIFSVAKPIFSGFRFFFILPHDVEVVDIIGLREERLAFSFHGHQNVTTFFQLSSPDSAIFLLSKVKNSPKFNFRK